MFGEAPDGKDLSRSAPLHGFGRLLVPSPPASRLTYLDDQATLGIQ